MIFTRTRPTNLLCGVDYGCSPVRPFARNQISQHCGRLPTQQPVSRARAIPRVAVAVDGKSSAYSLGLHQSFSIRIS